MSAVARVATQTTPASAIAAAATQYPRDPREIIRVALAHAERPLISTNFRPGAAVLLHLVTRAAPGIPVLWIDTGYNTPATYRYVETLQRRWNLNLEVYTPSVSAARRDAVAGGIPQPGDSDFDAFVEDTKLAPFRRAFAALRPDIWFTGVRREQTAFRRQLDYVSAGPGDSLRVAPLLEWQPADLAAYIEQHGIDDNDDYVDPTKPAAHLECGLQLLR